MKMKMMTLIIMHTLRRVKYRTSKVVSMAIRRTRKVIMVASLRS
jgi:hypothetical protein